MAPELTPAKRRVLDRLKTGGAATPGELAPELEMTDVAVRQHLQALRADGLVEPRKRAAEGRGRPSEEWSLTSAADAYFPDRHSDLTVELIDAARSAFGEKGLARLIEHRSELQAATYGGLVEDAGARLGARIRALAKRRSQEGYMADVERRRDGSYLLIERHCPICAAAKSCQRLCTAEREVFQAALGDGVTVERTEHLLSDGARCVYEIRPVEGR